MNSACICEVCGKVSTECACTFYDRNTYLLAQLREAREKLEAVEEACKQRKFPTDSPPQIEWFVQDVLRILHPEEG